MTDQISAQDKKEQQALREGERMVAKIETGIHNASQDIATFEEVLNNRLNAIGVPHDTAALTEISYMIGMAVGRLQSRGASLDEVHKVVEQTVDFGPGDDYEIRAFDSNVDAASHIVKGVTAVELWRWCRFLRCAVHELYIALRDAFLDNKAAGPHDVPVDELWMKAVGGVKVVVDALYPVLKTAS